MTGPDIAHAGRFKPGDILPADGGAPGGGLGGEVVLVRDLGPARQQLYFKDGAGGLVSMTVQLDRRGGEVLCGPVAPQDARALALLILAGREPRMSVTRQLNILAGALLAAGEAAPRPAHEKGDET